MQEQATLGSRTGGKTNLWAYGFGAAAVASILNAIILAIGKAAGVEFLVPQPGDPASLVEVTAFMAILSTVASIGIGTLATALIAPKINNGVFKFQVATAIFTALSLFAPLGLEDGTTALWLSSMHIVSGIAFIAALQRAKSMEGVR